MATAAAKKEFTHQYHNSLVYGNLAYDLKREELEHHLRHAGDERHEEKVARPAVKTVAAARPLVREAQRVSILSVAGFAAVAVMAVMVLMSYVTLTQLSSQVVDLKRELAALETDNVTLTAEYQRMYDLSAVKETAAAAGMATPVSGQVYYVDLSSGDSAVVYQTESPNVLSRLLTSLHHGVYTVVEYFN